MAIDPEELRQRRQERNMRQAKRVEQQRKLFVKLGIACAVLVACAVMIFVLVRAKSGDAAANTTPSESETGASQEAQAGTGEENTASEETVPEQTEKHPDTVIHLAAVGDLNVTDRVTASGGTHYDYTGAFLDVAHVLADADITVLNYEGNLTGAPYGESSKSVPQELMQALDRAGVDMVQLANSYAISKGISGLAETIQGVRAAGMEPLGVYEDRAAYRRGKGYTIREVEGIKIAFVAFTKGMDGMALPPGSENCVNILYEDYESTYEDIDTDGIVEVLEAAQKEKPDITVAMVHWGSENNDSISTSQERIASLMLDNGVDVILGTHAHFMHKAVYDEEEGTLVAYCLGDFFGDAIQSGTQYSVVLDVEITKDGRSGKVKISNVSYTPIYTVSDEDTLRVVRIREAMKAYEDKYVGAVSAETYADMQNALERIDARLELVKVEETQAPEETDGTE